MAQETKLILGATGFALGVGILIFAAVAGLGAASIILGFAGALMAATGTGQIVEGLE